jgi:hypothetical protein
MSLNIYGILVYIYLGFHTKSKRYLLRNAYALLGQRSEIYNNAPFKGTNVVGVLHRFVGRTPNVGHKLHQCRTPTASRIFSPGKNAFLQCTTTAAHCCLRSQSLKQ